ncbi:hypothetical protein Misp01_32510 [Microtetraspora sp. NBRC 13810]|uniref:hypothetical protein n=1 Tax=Microtetraspora sp. NBRC 13810 TaxID=3030990 RepID=UPI0024A3B56C|nr:hypothetical protein [Microtetraspora sp. NBRC 13810]GLW08121.1 hypothetical protein Misp01_32510 [Microtetraspora sp. NBRC 13810]
METPHGPRHDGESLAVRLTEHALAYIHSAALWPASAWRTTSRKARAPPRNSPP